MGEGKSFDIGRGILVFGTEKEVDRLGRRKEIADSYFKEVGKTPAEVSVLPLDEFLKLSRELARRYEEAGV